MQLCERMSGPHMPLKPGPRTEAESREDNHQQWQPAFQNQQQQWYIPVQQLDSSHNFETIQGYSKY